jgi:predicted GNAT family N-acyltransferase
VVYASQRLDLSRHNVQEFTCGNEELDRWLRSSADRADRQNTARTWVWSDDGRVVAYYSLCSHFIRRQDSLESPARVISEIPAVLLAKLAISLDLQGRGLGRQLLSDALTQCASSNEVVASRYVVVDAIDEAAEQFYVKHGFKRLPADRRLFMYMKDVRTTIDL